MATTTLQRFHTSQQKWSLRPCFDLQVTECHQVAPEQTIIRLFIHHGMIYRLVYELPVYQADNVVIKIHLSWWRIDSCSVISEGKYSMLKGATAPDLVWCKFWLANKDSKIAKRRTRIEPMNICMSSAYSEQSHFHFLPVSRLWAVVIMKGPIPGPMPFIDGAFTIEISQEM